MVKKQSKSTSRKSKAEAVSGGSGGLSTRALAREARLYKIAQRTNDVLARKLGAAIQAVDPTDTRGLTRLARAVCDCHKVNIAHAESLREPPPPIVDTAFIQAVVQSPKLIKAVIDERSR